jgi:ribosomal-protein-alanine N-acetyltransferase
VPPFHIREFRKSDFQRLWEIDQACFVSGIAYSQEELAYYMTRRTAFTMVAEAAVPAPDDGHVPHPEGRRSGTKSGERKSDAARIVGFLVGQCVRVRGEQIGHIITIDILPEARRSGLGTELMALAEKRLAESGCRRISLEVAVDNTGAIAFYQRHGYSIARVIPRYYNGELDALEMDKKL